MAGTAPPENTKPDGLNSGWFRGVGVFVGSLFLFYVSVMLIGRLSLPEWILPLFPLAALCVAVLFLRPAVTLFLWTLLVPIMPVPLVGDDLYLYDIMTLLLGGLWVARVYARGRFDIRGMDWLVVMVVVMAAFSVWVNTHRFAEVRDLIYMRQHRWLPYPGKLSVLVASLWFPYLMAYFFSSRLADTAKKQRYLLTGLFLAALVNTGWALWNWTQNPLGFSRENRTIAFLFETQDMGYLSAIALTGVLSIIIFRVGQKRTRYILMLAGIFFFLNLVLNFTRAVYVEFAFALFLLLVITRSFRLLLTLGLFGLIAFTVLLLYGIDETFLVMFTRIGTRKAFGLYARLQSWLDAVRIFREHGGFWGVGLGNFMPYSDIMIISPSLRRWRLVSAHGMYWQLLAEQGIPGLLVWWGFFAGWLVYFYRNFRRAAKQAGKALNLWIFLVVAMFTLDGVFYMVFLPPGHSRTALTAGYLVWVLIGLGVGYNRFNKPRLLPAERAET